ncbi:type IV secretion system protein [Vibrio fluvialis]|nr:type IV secretion system protein [Vibrio fluvialis]EMA2482773.1 type IV secretion system protein [Vibrio fluvialis]
MEFSFNQSEILNIIQQSPTIGDVLVQFFDYVVYGLIGEKFEPLNNALHILLSSMLLFVVFFQAILSMMGKWAVAYKQIAITAVWLIVAMIITRPETYNYYIVESISQFVVGLGQFFVGGNIKGGTTFMAVDNLFVRMFSLIDQMTDLLDAWDVLSLLLLVLLGGIFGALYAMFTIIIVFSKFALAVLLLFGGLVIQFSAFKSARGTLKTWLQAVFKYALTVVLATVIIVITSQLCIVIFDVFISQAAGQSGMSEDGWKDIDPSDIFGSLYWLLGLAGMVSVFLMWKVIELTSEITGGVATDMSQSFNAAANSANAAMTPIKMLASGATKKVFGK